MANHPKFKARPVSKRVLESAGDLGVPRVQRPAPTQPTEFNLSHANRGSSTARSDRRESDAGSAVSEPYTFKWPARPRTAPPPPGSPAARAAARAAATRRRRPRRAAARAAADRAIPSAGRAPSTSR